MLEKGPSLTRRIANLIQRVIGLLFHPEPEFFSKWVERLWFAGLYLFGGVVWSFFLNFGRLGFDLHDWTQEGPRYSFLRQALLENHLPLHIGSELAATDRFLAIPDTIISPQVVLLRFVEPGIFVLINTLFLYSLGYLGLLLLRRKFGWSSVTFSVVFLLFSLNGNPIAHIAVGHSMWVSYFLLPYFALLVINLIEGQVSWKWITQMALLQFALFLQGGFHFVIWSLMFLVLLGIFSHRLLGTILKAILFTILLSLVRILPPALEFSSKNNLFISGYFSVHDMLEAFTTLIAPAAARSGMYSALGWWEVDIYTGLLGFAFLIFFGLYQTWKTPPSIEAAQRQLLAPILTMTVLSIGKIFQPITMLPIPLMDTERVSSRFLILPVVMTLVLGGIQMERFLRNKTRNLGVQLTTLMLVGLTAHDLLQHARLWRVENLVSLFTRTPVNIHAQVILRVDPPYTTALLVGLGVGVLTFAFLMYKTIRERRKVSERSNPGGQM